MLVPIGSIEQHGPHLPLGTDSVIARAVAERVAARLPGQVLVAPAIAFGSSGEHAGFPGTVSIGRQALHAVVVESVRSLALWAARVVFVNGHGGNLATLAAAIGQLRAEGHEVAWVPCGVAGGDAHAGRTETSLMLHLAPADVLLERAAPGTTRPIAELMPELRAGGVRAVSPTGVLGDPGGASAEEGARMLEALVAEVAARIGGGAVDAHGGLVRQESA